MAFVQLTTAGYLPPGTDVETLLRETGFKHMLLAVLDTYHHRSVPLEHLPRDEAGGAKEKARAKVWRRMLEETAVVTPLQALTASRRLAELLVESRWYLMRDAREAGDSWAAIGDSLGITKQGAQDWYRRKIEQQALHLPDLHDAERAERALRDEPPSTEEEGR